MTVTVTTPAAHTELLLLETVKAELGITNSASDALLVSHIQRASAFIVRYTGRSFAKETVTETLAATGSPILLLSRAPILSVASITLDGGVVDPSDYSIYDADAGMLWKETGWTSTQIWAHNVELYPTGYGALDWSVSYTAGYVMPADPTAASTLPEDIQMAASALVRSWYLERDENPNVIKQTTGDASETKASVSGHPGVPPLVTTLLERWRRV